MQKYNSIIVLIVLALAAFFGWQKYNYTQQPIVIGYIGSLSGKFSDMGKTCRNGALLAVEEINNSGGINGQKIKLEIKDDNSSPTMSLEMAKILVSEGVQNIVGPFTSASAANVLSYINSEKILTIGPVIAGEKMARKDDFFIKMYPSTEIFGRELGRLAVQNMGIKNLAIIFDENNKAYSGPIADTFRKEVILLGGKIVKSVGFNSSGEISYSSAIDEIIKTDPDGLLVIAGPLHTAMTVQQLRIKGSKIQCFSSSWAANEDLISSGGKAVEGMLFYVPFDINSNTPKYKKFAANYQKRFSSPPSFCSIFNYDSISLLKQAIVKTNSQEPKKLLNTIISGSPYTGVQASFMIDANGDARHELILQTINNGKFSEVKSK